MINTVHTLVPLNNLEDSENVIVCLRREKDGDLNKNAYHEPVCDKIENYKSISERNTEKADTEKVFAVYHEWRVRRSGCAWRWARQRTISYRDTRLRLPTQLCCDVNGLEYSRVTTLGEARQD